MRPCHERVHVLLSTNVKQLVREEPARVMYLDDDDVVRDLYPELFRHGAVVGAASQDRVPGLHRGAELRQGSYQLDDTELNRRQRASRHVNAWAKRCEKRRASDE